MTKMISSFKEAEEYFERYSPPRQQGHYQLDRMRELMKRLGNPQNKIPVIHVAGTSGKTSTSYFIRALLQHSGMKTGLTVSPHITSIAERTQIDGKNLPEEIYLSYINQFKDSIMSFSDLEPTYFELAVAFSYWVFYRESVDYAVVETGLGGLLDATNVIDNEDKLCVITPIGYDHTQILGDTLQEIATQKAGIIGDKNEVLISHQNQLLMSVFKDAAAKKSARIRLQARYPVPQFLPAFQADNWQLARTAFDVLARRNPRIKKLSVVEFESSALETPPGRYEKYRIGDKTIILDGAHNPQKIAALIESIPVEAARGLVIMASLRKGPDGKIDDCIQLLTNLHRPIIVTEFKVGQDSKEIQSESVHNMAQIAERHGGEVVLAPDYSEAFNILMKSPGNIKLVTGSLYLVSLVRKLITRNYEYTH